MVVAQFVEQFLPNHLFTINCTEKTKIKKKEAGNGPFKKAYQESYIAAVRTEITH